NGQAWDINDKSCAERPIATLKKNGHYIFELRNLSQYQHPIHLHGMTFQVISSNRRKIDPWFTDTYLLGKNETARIALVADNGQAWDINDKSCAERPIATLKKNGHYIFELRNL
ncbi:multicopper oxidase domain-containing protein, partial [Acinetobacter baumannii]|uniref:multicopper oxidase domain-containing protein n=1 Tax=Acinetobacter baumannii TaxID=470 RepID=UPI001D1717D7